MTELSLHILDIIQNSIVAGAALITVKVNENLNDDILKIEISDNGCGMDEEFLKDVTDPFRTTRTTRRVGMGLSLFKHAAESCEGHFSISSVLGVGTKVEVTFRHSHIDRMPLGDMAETMVTAVTGAPKIDFVYEHIYDGELFVLDTREIKQILGEEVDICDVEVALWIKEYIKEGLDEILKEKGGI